MDGLTLNPDDEDPRLVVQRIARVLSPGLVLHPVVSEVGAGARVVLFCRHAALGTRGSGQLLVIRVVERERCFVEVLGELGGSRQQVLAPLGHATVVRVTDGVRPGERDEVLEAAAVTLREDGSVVDHILGGLANRRGEHCEVVTAAPTELFLLTS